ncbi:hypothetical protein NLU13_6577 [Sarocladium strictum]|uniref:Serum paraoxonase/arylesterase family protein n=1 Tax=Sarocladium strictum TaxID=5046 RepID=A0AA39GGR9_SARSR|nr:hypothetical protein NLU13_6577 [Sarocladium strictum]
MTTQKTALAVLVPLILSYGLHLLLTQQLTVLGAFRKEKQTPVDNPNDLVVISGTVNCEDLHYHAPSNSIFTACDDVAATRRAWFPPLAVLIDPVAGSTARGSLQVIDTKTMKSRRLELVGFDGPFVTHGIDVISAPKSESGDEAVYILAVNHVPHIDYVKAKASGLDVPSGTQRADPRIETFYHVLGTDSASHVRTTKHPLIKTPNDIFAIDSRSFIVTNDHFYEDGLMRTVEDIIRQSTWSSTIHVRIPETADERVDAPCDATVVLSGLHNNNGLGHGPAPDQILIGSAASGAVRIGRLPKGAETSIQITETLQFESSIDNPSYFSDPYANATFDASGIVNAGLTRAVDLAEAVPDPEAQIAVMVWYSRPVLSDNSSSDAEGGAYETRLLFEDDGQRISTASSAVLVAIDPKLEQGRRKAWLYVSGFQSRNAIAVKVDL